MRTVLLLGLLTLPFLLSACVTQPSAESFLIRSPEPFFQWTFPNGLDVRHIGSGSVRGPSHTPIPAHIIELAVPAQAIADKTGTLRETLFVTEDFRFAIASLIPLCFRPECQNEAEDRAVSFCPPDQPWLFGASHWFGQEARVGAHPNWTVKIAGGFVQIEGDHPTPLVRDGKSACSFFALRGQVHFASDTAAPRLLGGRPLSKDIVIEGPVNETTRPTKTDPRLDFQAAALPPTPVETTDLFIRESSTSYRPFPLREAIEQLEPNLTGSEVLLAASSLDTASSVTVVGQPVSSSWHWNIDVLFPNGQPVSYTVVKGTNPVTGTGYSVDRSDHDVRLSRPSTLPDRLVPIDLARIFVNDTIESIGITSLSFNSGLFLGGEPGPLRPHVSFGLGNGTAGASIRSIRLDATTGEAVTLIAPPGVVDAFLGFGYPEAEGSP